MLTNSRNKRGIANSVNRLEKDSPQTIAVATAPHISDSPPSPSDDIPAMVNVVINSGITRRLAAYIVAWVMLMQIRRRVLLTEIKIMAAFTMIPVSAIAMVEIMISG